MERLLFAFILLLQIFLFPLAEAKVPPAPTTSIYVQDYASVITPEHEEQILQLGKELENKTTAQLVVVTIPGLEGQVLEEYSLELLRTWGIGQKEKNNGALLLIAIKDRQSRIEVGYGLEGTLTDGITGRIQDEYMIPYFKDNDYSTGIYKGYMATATTIANGSGAQLQDSTIEAVVPKSEGEQILDIIIDSFIEAFYYVLFPVLALLAFLLFMFIDHYLFKDFFTKHFLSGSGGGGSSGSSGGSRRSSGSSSSRSYGGGSGGGGGSSRGW